MYPLRFTAVALLGHCTIFVAAIASISADAREGGSRGAACTMVCDARWCSRSIDSVNYGAVLGACSNSDMDSTQISISTHIIRDDVKDPESFSTSNQFVVSTGTPTLGLQLALSPFPPPTIISTPTSSTTPTAFSSPSIISVPSASTRIPGSSSLGSPAPNQSSGPPPQGTPKNKRRNTTLIAALVPSLVLGAAFIVLLILYLRRIRKTASPPTGHEQSQVTHTYRPNQMEAQNIHVLGGTIHNASLAYAPNNDTARPEFHQALPNAPYHLPGVHLTPPTNQYEYGPLWGSMTQLEHPYLQTRYPGSSPNYQPYHGVHADPLPATTTQTYPTQVHDSPTIQAPTPISLSGQYRSPSVPLSPPPHMSPSGTSAVLPGYESVWGDSLTRSDNHGEATLSIGSSQMEKDTKKTDTNLKSPSSKDKRTI